MTSCHTKFKELCLPCYLPIAGERIAEFIPFSRVFVLCEINQPSPGFEPGSPGLFPMTITITLQPLQHDRWVLVEFIWHPIMSEYGTRPFIMRALHKSKPMWGGDKNSWSRRYSPVAERTSYFCLARKLIWPLGSTHIFTQWGWLILFSPDHFPGQHKNGENPPNTSLPQDLSNSTDAISVRYRHSSRSTTPWGKPSNLWTFWVYPLWPRVPSWTWIRCMESATHRNTFVSPPTFAMSTATRNFAQTSNYIISVLKQ